MIATTGHSAVDTCVLVSVQEISAPSFTLEGHTKVNPSASTCTFSGLGCRVTTIRYVLVVPFSAVTTTSIVVPSMPSETARLASPLSTRVPFTVIVALL